MYFPCPELSSIELLQNRSVIIAAEAEKEDKERERRERGERGGEGRGMQEMEAQPIFHL